MKHVKSFELFEKATKAEYNSKIKDLKDKIRDLASKYDDLSVKNRDEKDAYKQEINALTLQKIQFQEEIAKIDININKIKRTIL